MASARETTQRLVGRLEALEHAAARKLAHLAGRAPAWALRRVAREVDGVRLHPELQLILAARSLLGGADLSASTPEAARARLRRDARVHAGIPLAVGSVHDLTFAGPACMLRARHYTPPGTAGAPPKPLVVFYHGGGFVTGDLDTHDPPCRALCRALDAHVLSVEYRLAPEHPFPAGVEDARAALRFAQAHAALLGADPARIAVAGDSAGANLATVVTQLAAQAGDPVPALQLLIYPTTDSTLDWPSMERFAEGFFLTRADVRWFRRQYLAAADASDPRVSPLLGRLDALPPAVIVTAGFDPLRDEGEAYAAALEAAGTRVLLQRMPDLIHGFINLGAVSGAARSALERAARIARSMLSR